MFTVPDDEPFVDAVVRMTSMRDSPCGVRLVGWFGYKLL